MAFHVACPITCRRICFCELGFPRNLQASRSRIGFWDEVIRVEEFLNDPWGARISGCGTVQVPVPKVVPVPAGDGGGGADAADEAAALSAQAKRLALQRKATAAMVAAEDYARRVESGDIGVASRSPARDEHGQSSANAICRMCFLGESEGSERARRMLSCRTCGKKYHRSCLKSWAQHRDLFHWSSWTCPYCRSCEVCRSTGDPTRLMFCKRCDDAYHCYCQHPSHKNVTAGPYLCPKHTRCHSCASTVPGNGLSVRWFLGYTCCDACGRLFVKGNYCPVCLKVYRDSESTPMVCCDVCQRWVHCQCDGISDEKYLQFQVDGNLQYKCATCRGECYQVKDLEDAVQELWRRKDNADKDLIVSLRAAAGLPTQEEIFSITPYSDDEENGPAISKSEFGRSLKFSLKGLVDKSPKKSKDNSKKSMKKYPKKKPYESFGLGKDEPCRSFDESQSFQSQGCSFDEDRSNVLLSRRNEGQDVSSVAGICSTNEPGVLKHRCVDDVMVGGEDKKSRVLKIKSNRLPDMDNGEDNGKDGSKSNSLKAKKLVINLGARKINVTNSPKSDASIPREQELVSSNGDKAGHNSQSRNLRIAGKEGNLIKFGKVKIGAPEVNHKVGRANSSDANEACPPEESLVMHRKVNNEGRKVNNEGSKVADGPASGVPSLRGGKIFSEKNLERRANTSNENNDDQRRTPTSNLLSKDSKPLLKFKFKKPNLENQNSQSPLLEEERSCIKGQRSKRKRPSPFIDKSFVNEDSGVDATQSPEDNLREAGWILKKLGKDAAGKRVEVLQTSDNTWHKGTVTDVFDSTSQVSVMLDDGRVKTLELGEQSVRFLLQKQKRSKI